MEIDLKKIKELALKKEKKNWKFRSFLKGCDDDEVDLIVHRLLKEVSAEIDCTVCGNCCKELQFELLEGDIGKLAEALNIAPEKFQTDYLQEDEEGDKLFKQSPCPFLCNNKCTQYEFRPETCVSYPHLHKKEFTSRLFGVLQNYSICPIVFNVYEGLKKELW